MQVIWCFLILLGIKKWMSCQCHRCGTFSIDYKKNISTFLLALVQRAIFFFT